MLEHAVERANPKLRTSMARDAYSLGHFPMLCGVVAYAVALEEALAHPTEALPAEGRLAVALGLALFLGGTAFAMWRTTGKVPVARVAVTLAAAAGVYLLADVAPVITLSVAFVGVAMIAGHDEWRARRLSTEPA